MFPRHRLLIPCLLTAVFACAQTSWASEPEAPVTGTGVEETQADEAPSTLDEQTESSSETETAEQPKETIDQEPPEVLRDLSVLPFPTRRMRELILEASKAGDIEKLRSLIGVGDSRTQLSLGAVEDDPIAFLKSQSGDEDGHELLAILEEVLEAGFVRLDAGTENEIYVWPYFFAYPLDALDARQRVELFRIATYGDYQDMRDFGGYIFYRVGISPSGRWQFFVAGD